MKFNHSLTFHHILLYVCLHAHKTPPDAPEDAPKTLLKTPSRRRQDAPRTPKTFHRRPTDLPKTLPKISPKIPRSAPKKPPNVRKMAQDALSYPYNAPPNDAPRGTQDAPHHSGGALLCAGSAQIPQKQPISNPLKVQSLLPQGMRVGDSPNMHVVGPSLFKGWDIGHHRDLGGLGGP